MNKDKDSSLADNQEYRTLKYPKLVSQAEELPKKTQIVHLLRCMSQRNQPGKKVLKKSNSFTDYSNISILGNFIKRSDFFT